MKKQLVNIYSKGSNIFLLLVFTAYLIVLALNTKVVFKALSFSFSLLVKLIPLLILVFLFLVLIDYLVSPKMVIRYLGESSGIKGWFLSLLGGIISTGPIYMWYPLLKALKERGMSDSLIAVFLYNRAVKIPMLPVMIYYFGLKLVIVLTFWMLCASILVGWIVGKLS